MLLVLLLGSSLFFWSCTSSKAPKKSNVLLIILDTLRADHLSGYGYIRDTSPNLDAFAREAIRFDRAISVAPWTPPSVATLFTGLYPSSHGMMPPDARQLARKEAKRLDPKLDTLAEVFGRAGFQTGGISPNPWITSEFGYDQGYDNFYYHHRKPADFITREGKEMIENLLASGKPFFASLHYLDPHDPYSPPEGYAEMFAGLPLPGEYNPEMTNHIQRYDGEIRFLDEHLGELFRFLKEKGIFDDLGIVIVADHGEQFLEHGDHRHGYQLYDEEVRVPLYVKPPGGKGAGTVFSKTVSTVDVFPTLLDMAGVAGEKGGAGIVLTQPERLEARLGVLSEINRKYHQRAVSGADGLRMIAGTFERGLLRPEDYLNSKKILFDAVNDTLGRSPLLDSTLRKRYDSMLSDLLLFVTQENRLEGEGENDVEIDSETLEQLKSLGYLE